MSKTHRRSSFLAFTPSSSEKSSEFEFWRDLEDGGESVECAAAGAQCDLGSLEAPIGLVQVRAATRTQLQNDLSVARAEVKRELWALFEREKRKYTEETEKLREKCDNVRMVAIGKDAEIGKLRGVIAEQEVVITALRLGVIVSERLQQTHLKAEKPTETVDFLRAESHSLHEKVAAFTDITRLLRSENGELQEKLTETKDELKSTVENYEEKLKCQIELYENRLQTAGKKYEELFHT
jgi:hypothetical protein